MREHTFPKATYFSFAWFYYFNKRICINIPTSKKNLTFVLRGPLNSWKLGHSHGLCAPGHWLLVAWHGGTIEWGHHQSGPWSLRWACALCPGPLQASGTWTLSCCHINWDYQEVLSTLPCSWILKAMQQVFVMASHHSSCEAGDMTVDTSLLQILYFNYCVNL